MIQQSLFAARQARDLGVARSSGKNAEWMDRAIEMLKVMAAEHQQTTGEGIRVWLRYRGLGEPSSPHAWGALTNALVNRGVLKDTGRVVQMATERSHARRTPLWEFA